MSSNYIDSFTILPFKSGGQPRPVVSCCFNREGDLALTTSLDGTTFLWHIDEASASGNCIRIIGRYTASTAMKWSCFSPTSNFVAVSTTDGYARIYDTFTGIIVAELNHKEHRGYNIVGVEFSADGRYLFTYSTSLHFNESYIFAWDVSDLNKPELARSIKAQAQEISKTDPKSAINMYILPENQRLKASFVARSSMRDSDEELTAMCVITNKVDGENNVMVGSKNGAITLYTFKNNDEKCGFQYIDEYSIDEGEIKDITYNENTNFYTVASRGGKVDIFYFNSKSIEQINQYSTAFGCNSAVYHPKNDIIAYVGGIDAKDVTTTAQTSNTFKVCFIDPIHNNELGEGIDGNNYHIGTVHKIRFSPSGTVALSVSEDGSSFFWKFDEKEILEYKYNCDLLSAEI